MCQAEVLQGPLPAFQFIPHIHSLTDQSVFSLWGLCLSPTSLLLWHWPLGQSSGGSNPVIPDPSCAHTLHPLALPAVASKTLLFLKFLNIQSPGHFLQEVVPGLPHPPHVGLHYVISPHPGDAFIPR